jgi:hypothetical protein
MRAQLWVCDAGRANGEPSLTRVNGKDLGPNPQQLQPEDVIEVFNRRFRVGNQTLCLYLVDARVANSPRPD